MATPPVVVAVPITRGLNPTTTITTHTLIGEERKILISSPGPFVDQGGVCQGVPVESWMGCNITTGEVIPTSHRPDGALYPLDQGDGRDVCSGQRPNGKREGASIRSNRNSFLARHLRPGKPHESRRVELLVEISSAMLTGGGWME